MNSVFDAINTIKDNAEKAIPVNPGDYIGEDGMYYCGKCKTKKQDSYEFAWGTMTVMQLCKCEKEREASLEKQRKIRRLEDGYFRFKESFPNPCIELLKWFDDHKQYEESRVLKGEKVSLLKKLCFSEEKMLTFCFEKDDLANPNISGAMRRYAEGFDKFLSTGKGICLFGDVGVGKSYFAACIANYLTERGVAVLMTNFESIRNRVQEGYSGRQRFIDGLQNYKLLIIDDFASESDSDYMYELVFSVIDKRIKSGLPMIITTNLKKEELSNPSGIKNSRLYSRILGSCYPIHVKGNDRRREALKKNGFDMKCNLEL